MNNPLYVTVLESQGNIKTLLYYVNVHCTISEAIEEIKPALKPDYTFIKASFLKHP